MQSKSLTRCYKDWLKLHKFVDKTRVLVSRETLRAPFFSAKCEGEPYLLYVGMAPSGYGFCEDTFQKKAKDKEQIKERCKSNRDYVIKDEGKRGFWLFFRELNQELNNRWDPSCKDYRHAIWSNLAKIYTSSGNPREWLRSIQTPLAARTLCEEIKDYRPKLIVFVTASFGDDIVFRGTDTSSREWKKSPGEGDTAKNDVWWLAQSQANRLPACLWVRHPSRAIGPNTRALWLKTARKALDG